MPETKHPSVAEQERNTRAITGGRCNDLIVSNGGSVYLVMPVTEAGRQWLKDTAPEDAQFLGYSMAVEWRYIEVVKAAARDAGLTVA